MIIETDRSEEAKAKLKTAMTLIDLARKMLDPDPMMYSGNVDVEHTVYNKYLQVARKLLMDSYLRW